MIRALVTPRTTERRNCRACARMHTANYRARKAGAA